MIDRVGVNHATTETCFCDIHDDEVFAPIEKGAPAFDKDSDEHKYIYAYKAFIFEYYKKLVEQKVLRENITNTPSLLKTPQYIQYYRAISMTLEEMNEVKSFFDKGIVSKDYTGLETCVIEIPESIKFATYACIAVDFDLKGKKIRHTKRGFISRLFITIFPEETKSYIILSCLSEDIKIYKKFFQQLQTTNLDKVKYYFDLILPLYTENNVLSPRLWEKWGEEQQIGYTFFANRKGKQFLLYKQILKLGMYNLPSFLLLFQLLSKYVTYLRLEHAKQLLQNTDIPVTEVAMLSGYQNVSYFIRSFKKTYGVSPLKYRKNKSSTWS